VHGGLRDTEHIRLDWAGQEQGRSASSCKRKGIDPRPPPRPEDQQTPITCLILGRRVGFGQQHSQVHVLAFASVYEKRQREKPVLRTGSNSNAMELSLTHTTQTEENWAISTVLSDLVINLLRFLGNKTLFEYFSTMQNRGLVFEIYVFEFSFDDLGSYYILARSRISISNNISFN
jgi:hypothetical protein